MTENNNNNNVILSIRTRQSFDGAGTDAIELLTEGLLCRNREGYTLSYSESELTGLEGTRTVIRIGEGILTLLREGSFHSQMVFREGRRHLSFYQTPYGALEVGIYTRRMRSTLTEFGGEVEIDYLLELDHRVAGFNLFQMNVRPKPDAITQSTRDKREGNAYDRQYDSSRPGTDFHPDPKCV